MAYTNETIQSGNKIQKVDVSELASALSTLAMAKKVSIDLSALKYSKVLSLDIETLQKAVHTLESAFSGNCCQANCCQTCQGCQNCQVCQSCQGCQTCQGCQSSSCQSCQKQYNRNCNRNCDCGDDGGF